jgi:hypothetical protein
MAIAKKFGNNSVLASEPLSSTGQFNESELTSDISVSGAIVGFSFHGTTSGQTIVVRSTNSSGKVLLELTAGTAAFQHVEIPSTQWRRFTTGLHATVGTGITITVYYLPDEQT